MQHLHRVRLQIKKFSQKPLVQGFIWMAIGKGLRLVLQAAYFVIIARSLGVENYGEFVGITALVAIVSPFVGLGIDVLLVKNVAKDRSVFSEYWGNCLLMILVTGVVFLPIFERIAPMFLPHSISIASIFLVTVSDLIFGSIANVAIRAFQAVDLLNISAQISVFSMFVKVLASICLVQFFPHPDVMEWICLYLASSGISALLCLVLVQHFLGSPTLALWRIKSELIEGVSFSISNSAYTIYNDIDKTLLAKLSTLSATGIYAAAYRLIDVAFIPVISVAGAAYADFFRQGKDGVGAALRFAKPLVRVTSAYSIAIGICLLLFAPIVPYILGNEYLNVVPALRWLAPIPLFRAMQHFGGDILSGSGFQRFRSVAEVTIAIFNIAINLWLIPQYSWLGAAWGSLASDGLLMVMFWLLVAVFYRREKLLTRQAESD